MKKFKYSARDTKGKPVEGEASEDGKIRNANSLNNLMRFIKGLHSGRIGNTNHSLSKP